MQTMMDEQQIGIVRLRSGCLQESCSQAYNSRSQQQGGIILLITRLNLVSLLWGTQCGRMRVKLEDIVGDVLDFADRGLVIFA